MTGFDYNRFKEALLKAKEDSYAVLVEDVEKVKANVEKLLTMFLDSNTNKARTCYPGVDI